jgi:hypothetical protein
MSASLIVNATTFDWISLRGEVEPLGMVLEDVTRPGVNGQAYRQVGQRGQAFEMVGVADYASLAAANTAYASLKALVGSPGSIIDDYAITSSLNIILLDVRRLGIRPVRSAVGGLLAGSGQALLTVRMTLQRVK